MDNAHTLRWGPWTSYRLHIKRGFTHINCSVTHIKKRIMNINFGGSLETDFSNHLLEHISGIVEQKPRHVEQKQRYVEHKSPDSEHIRWNGLFQSSSGTHFGLCWTQTAACWTQIAGYGTERACWERQPSQKHLPAIAERCRIKLIAFLKLFLLACEEVGSLGHLL